MARTKQTARKVDGAKKASPKVKAVPKAPKVVAGLKLYRKKVVAPIRAALKENSEAKLEANWDKYFTEHQHKVWAAHYKGEPLDKQLKRLRTDALKAWNGKAKEETLFRNVTENQHEKLQEEEKFKEHKKAAVLAAVGKRPLTGYFRFSQEYRKNNAAEVAGKSISEQSKLLSAAWKALTAAKRASYDAQSKKAWKEREAKLDKLPEAKLKAPREKALTAYNVFVSENMEKIAAQSGLPHKEVMAEVGKLWRGLSAAEKAEYVKKSEADAKNYPAKEKKVAEKKARKPRAKKVSAKKTSKKKSVKKVSAKKTSKKKSVKKVSKKKSITKEERAVLVAEAKKLGLTATGTGAELKARISAKHRREAAKAKK